MAKDANPVTRYQMGRRWATATLVLCGAFSIWANVRSGQIMLENVIVSVLPPVVSFFTSHLIGYFNPRTKGQKVLVWLGMGTITIFAMIGSGWHIVEYVVHTGQIPLIGFVYIFITDAPMLLALFILIEKVPTARTVPNRTTATQPAKQTQTAKKTQPVKKAPPRTKPVKPDILADPFEREMLTA